MLATQNRYGLNWDATLPVYVGKRTPRPTTKIELGKRINQIEFDYKNLVAQNLPYTFIHQNPVQLKKLVGRKPLVISFLSNGWNEYGSNHLEKLQQVYQEILAIGGNLLVIINAKAEEVRDFQRHFNIGFNLLADPEQKIAKSLGLFQEEYPVWDYVSGISEDVPVPATIVINTQEKVVYSSVDDNFDKPFQPTEMLAAVFGANKNIPVVIRQELAA
jgi:peroxiredoxin